MVSYFSDPTSAHCCYSSHFLFLMAFTPAGPQSFPLCFKEAGESYVQIGCNVLLFACLVVVASFGSRFPVDPEAV